MRNRLLRSLAVAMFLSTFVLAFVAGTNDTTGASVAAAETRADAPRQPLVFDEGEQTAQAGARAMSRLSSPLASLTGPLAGTRVITRSTDEDQKIEVIVIPGPDCIASKGASFVLQDEDGTQADFIDNDNVQIGEIRRGLKVVSNDDGQDANIVPLNERGGRDGGEPALDTGGLVIVTSTGIRCGGNNPSPSPARHQPRHQLRHQPRHQPHHRPHHQLRHQPRHQLRRRPRHQLRHRPHHRRLAPTPTPPRSTDDQPDADRATYTARPTAPPTAATAPPTSPTDAATAPTDSATDRAADSATDD